MFLKRLETVGFKSFAERIEIEFVPGVTAVVGPNGSGKSNIIDAVRWVLGEQSAKSLRGQKMEDIIFQGSDTRNQLNFAEVSLILDNRAEHLPIDFQEVNVTRRVYRSGESEFFINKQSCRLKDIVDLFMDTGLGRESFSIIGQGKIDEILSSKAEDRRAIFEEAAGVLKYKQRKNTAVFKLNETEDNLDRVEDIIHEIKQQLTPLEEQAAIARKYQEKKAALEKVEVALIVTEIEALHEKWQQLLSHIEETKIVEMNKKVAIQKREANITKERHNLEELDLAITSLQNELLSVSTQLEQLDGERNVYLERKKHVQENKQKLLADHENICVKMEETEAAIFTEKRALQQIIETIRDVKAEISKLEQKLFHGLDIMQEEIEDLKSDYIEYLNEQAVLRNEKEMNIKQQNQIKQWMEREKADHETGLIQEKNLANQVQQLKKKMTEQKKLIADKEERLNQKRLSLIQERKEFEEMQRRLYEGNEQIAKYHSRKEMLEEMKESFQGYYYGVKEILKAVKKGQLRHVDGVVIDLIEVPTTYITAIDTILGAQAQHIVVPDDEVARELIHWLKRESKGRATFLPIKSIEPRTIANSLQNTLQSTNGFIGIASELVKVDEKYKKVSEHLMGNVIVVEDLYAANQIAQLTGRRYRIVTLDGDVVNPGGSMSGGAQKKTSQSLFSREKEIITLNEKIQQFTIRRDQFMQKIASKETMIHHLEEEIIELENTLQTNNYEHQSIEKKYNEFFMKFQTMQENLSAFHMRLAEKEEDLQQLKETERKLSENLQTLNEKIGRTEQAVEHLTNEQKTVQENKKMMEKELHELQIKVAEQEERKKSFQGKISSLTEQLNQLRDEKTQLQNELQALEEIEHAAMTEEELSEKIIQFKEQSEQLKADIEQKQSYRKNKVQEIDDEEREIKQLSKLHEKIVQDIQEKEVQASRLDVSLENKFTFLQTEYRMTYERAKEKFGLVEDLEAAKVTVKELKQSIERLGTVNLGSIEEYERLSERYEFLLKQQQDLVQAKETLFEVINEMDEEMTSRFGTMFKEIQSSFTSVFKQLFGGGYAELSLTNPENLLETGIEIVARPPGKKLRSLELLSGGERALTAIALLFAILRARPIPFCILDEVDAALDEANVERFGQYLKSFSEETQFIVITHRKGTMEEADALYGVTMQESGVSRLVSVKLEDMEQLAAIT